MGWGKFRFFKYKFLLSYLRKKENPPATDSLTFQCNQKNSLTFQKKSYSFKKKIILNDF